MSYSSNNKKEGIIQYLKKRYPNLRAHSDIRKVMNLFCDSVGYPAAPEGSKRTWNEMAQYIQEGNWDVFIQYLYKNNNKIKKL